MFLLSECVWGFVYTEFCLFQVKLLHNLHLVLASEAFLSLGSLLCLAGWLGFFGVLFVFAFSWGTVTAYLWGVHREALMQT